MLSSLTDRLRRLMPAPAAPSHQWIVDRFSDPAAHELMLRDTARCDAYRRAIHSVVRPGDRVIDLGAGTGLLSLFAAEAGAREVLAIEMSAIANVAEQIIARNGMSDSIRLERRRSTEVTVAEPFDVLISETFSIMGFDTEDMVSFFADARRRLLVPNARVLPMESRTFVVPVQSNEVGPGAMPEQLYGFDFSPLRTARFSPQPIRVEVNGTSVRPLATPQCPWTLDFSSATATPGAATLVFDMEIDSRVDGLLGWFESTLAPDVTLSNAPDAPATHWGQIFFPILEQPLARAGQRLEVVIDPGIRAGWPSWSYTWRLQ